MANEMWCLKLILFIAKDGSSGSYYWGLCSRSITRWLGWMDGKILGKHDEYVDFFVIILNIEALEHGCVPFRFILIIYLTRLK